jgi:outer membrane protein assembly factor BamB
VVSGSTLVYLDEQEGQEVAHRVNTANGQEQWHTPMTAAFGDEWGKGPRSTPILDGDRVYAQACNGEFRCLNLADGKVVWEAGFERTFGVKFLGSKANEGTASRRGNNGCGVIDDQRLILPAGGTNDHSLVCLDKATGKLLWHAGQDEAAYSSLLVSTLAGTRQVIAFTAEALMGVELERGTILWRVPLKTGAKRHAATPVLRGDDIFVNSQTIGLVCLRIKQAGGQWTATTVWANKSHRINISTPVLAGDHLYSQGSSRDLICVEAATGQLKWSQTGFGRDEKDYSALIAADGKLLVLSNNGVLTMLKQQATGYEELGRVQACGTTWSHPALAGQKLYVRDGRSLSCYDLGR